VSKTFDYRTRVWVDSAAPELELASRKRADGGWVPVTTRTRKVSVGPFRAESPSSPASLRRLRRSPHSLARLARFATLNKYCLAFIMKCMVDFTLPDATRGLQYCFSRQPSNIYRLMYARAYGMADGRQVAVLNPSTPTDAPFAPSPKGRPLVWIEEDGHPCFRLGIVTALLGADRPIVARTGRTRRVRTKYGEELESIEVEILLDEDQLSRGCRHCDDTELVYDPYDRLERVGGEGYASMYCCSQVRFCLRIDTIV
jgi:hypothetical protein